MAEIAESPRRVSDYVRSLPTDVRTRYLDKTASFTLFLYHINFKGDKLTLFTNTTSINVSFSGTVSFT